MCHVQSTLIRFRDFQEEEAKDNLEDKEIDDEDDDDVKDNAIPEIEEHDEL